MYILSTYFIDLVIFPQVLLLAQLVTCQYLSLHRKHRPTLQNTTIPSPQTVQSYNNRNTDLNIARHLHQVHLKRQQEHSITGRCYGTAKKSACVHVFRTIRLFSHLVWLLGLNLSVFKHSIRLQAAVYLRLHHVFLNTCGCYQKRELLSSSLFYSFVWV